MGLRERTAKARHGLGRLRPLLAAWQLLHRRRLAPAKRRYRELGLRKPGLARSATPRSPAAATGLRRLDRPGRHRRDREPMSASRHSTRSCGKDYANGRERGYLVAEGFFDPDSVAALNLEIDRLAAAGTIRGHHRRPALHEHSPELRGGAGAGKRSARARVDRDHPRPPGRAVPDDLLHARQPAGGPFGCLPHDDRATRLPGRDVGRARGHRRGQPARSSTSPAATAFRT